MNWSAFLQQRFRQSSPHRYELTGQNHGFYFKSSSGLSSGGSGPRCSFSEMLAGWFLLQFDRIHGSSGAEILLYCGRNKAPTIRIPPQCLHCKNRPHRKELKIIHKIWKIKLKIATKIILVSKTLIYFVVEKDYFLALRVYLLPKDSVFAVRWVGMRFFSSQHKNGFPSSLSKNPSLKLHMGVFNVPPAACEISSDPAEKFWADNQDPWRFRRWGLGWKALEGRRFFFFFSCYVQVLAFSLKRKSVYYTLIFFFLLSNKPTFKT